MKYFTYDRYIPLFVDYLDFDRKDVKASSLFLFSPFEELRLAILALLNIGKDVSMPTSFSYGPNSPQVATKV